MAAAKIEEVGVQAFGVQTDVTKAASVDQMVRATLGDAVVFLASDASGYISGITLPVTGVR